MERLAPPDISHRAATADDVELDIPPDGIARNELLRQYQRQMARPLPEAKALVGELTSWSGSLARTEWFAPAYSPTAGLVLKGRSARVSDDETLDAILSAVAELVDPFARYSAGWTSSLAVLRPENLRNEIHVAIREAQRYGARMVRRSMTSTVPTVHETRDAATNFLADPAWRHEQDRQTALDAYLAKVSDVVVKFGTSSKQFTDSELRVLVELQETLVDEMGAVPVEPVSEQQETRNREDANQFLADVVETRLRGRTYDERHLAEAYSRVLVTYVNRLRRGLPLQGTENYLLMRLAAVRIDEWRRETLRKKHEGQFVAGDDDGSSRADDRVEDSTATSDEVRPEQMLLRTASGMIDADPLLRIDGQLCWEAQTARALLAAAEGDWSGSQRDLVAVITQMWVEQQPSHARSATPDIALTDVLLLMRTTVNQAKRILDDSDEGVMA